MSIEILKRELEIKRAELENLSFYVNWLKGAIKVEEVKEMLKNKEEEKK